MATIHLTSAAVVAAAILRTRKPGDEGASHTWEYAYRAPNGRQFEIREFEDGQFFMSEWLPGARARVNGRVRGVEALKALLGDPNGFAAAARVAGYADADIMRSGAGLGIGSRYFDDMDGVVGAIRGAIEANAWYDSVDQALLKERSAEAKANEARDRQAWEEAKRAEHERAVAEGEGIFKGLHSMLGPISKDRRDAILSYLNAPTQAGWDAVSRTCVKGTKTLWQAWLAVEPSAPRSLPQGGKWPRIPDPEILRSAMREIAGLSPADRPDGEAEVVVLRR